METIDVRYQVLTSIVDGNQHLSYFIQKYLKRKNFAKISRENVSQCFIVISMVIQGIKMFSYTAITILRTQSPLDCSPSLCQEYATVLLSITLASLSTPLKNQQPEFQCGENSKFLQSTRWRLHFVAQTGETCRVYTTPVPTTWTSAEDFVFLSLYIATLMSQKVSAN